MIQEIAPHILDNAFLTRSPKDDDIIMALDNNIILGSPVTGKFYTYGEIKENAALAAVTLCLSVLCGWRTMLSDVGCAAGIYGCFQAN